MLKHIKAICIYFILTSFVFLATSIIRSDYFCDPDCFVLGRKNQYLTMALELSWAHMSPSTLQYDLSVKPIQVKNRLRLLFGTPWTAAYQAPLPMVFSRQEYWSGLPLPSPFQGARAFSLVQSLSAVTLEPKKINSVTASTFSPSICHEMVGLDAMILGLFIYL